MKIKYCTVLIAWVLISCNWAKEKAKEGVNKTGEVVAKTGSEFANGMYKGVEKTFQNKAVFSKELTAAGLKAGKIIIHGTDSTSDNILSAYLIFDKNINKKIIVKVFTEDGSEYGRTTLNINGMKDDAKYFDIVFDKRTNIESKGTVTFE